MIKKKKTLEEKKLKTPNLEELRAELKRLNYKIKFNKLLKNTLSVLLCVSAISVLIATLLLPVLQIYGTSMSPTLTEGDIVLSVKTNNIKREDIIAFYYNNKILVKRVIAGPGEWITINKKGKVYVNDTPLKEKYISEFFYGDCDISFPFQVPGDSYFVMGDHRETSLDSRNSVIGTVSKEDIVGKIIFTIWPIKHIGR